MRRRNRLIATLAALFVLQAPLCVLACLSGAVPAESSTATPGDSPCHEQAPSSNPSDPADSHDDCGCEDSYTAVLAGADRTFWNIQSAPVLPPHSLEAPLGALASRTKPVQPIETDLPPPDILLLKSTLLI